MSTGVVRTYHDNEQTKLYQEYFIINDIVEGEYKSYHENNQLWNICNYINGKREGDYYFYNKKAELTTVCKYLNDIKIDL